ncbi:MAG: SDR family NAD(P)-dependent oxidoreductase [Actinomycetota bacterium]|jgi:NAD(P)-dependent dehydrogenase (short-subunit alcohol dehydrogenase family)|nr:SDR family NAD(P)-dependent oxidoreductase [Actinomycetota bacterium]
MQDTGGCTCKHDDVSIDLQGQVAIVTGAGKGIGRAIALGLADRGAAVVVNNRCRDGADPAAEVVATIVKRGGRAVVEHSSVESPGAAQAIVGTAIDTFGRLDMVVANAAIIDRAKFGSSEPQRFREVIEVDFFATVEMARAALPQLKEHSGRLLFVTSSAGTYGEYGVSSYAAAKGAINGFAKTLALELDRDDVRVNQLAPYAATQMTETVVPEGQAEALSPAFVVPAAMWLLHPAVPVTGAIVVAAANRFRTIVAGETDTLVFPGPDAVDDEQFAAAAERLLDVQRWQPHHDGFASFTELMTAEPPEPR